MKKTTTTLLSRMCVAIGAAALLSGLPNAANATQTVRELWDHYNKGPLQGDGSNFTSVGQDTNTTWQVSPPGNTSLTIDPAMEVWGYLGIDDNSLLPVDDSSGSGALAYYGSDGDMDTTLTNPVTSLPYGDYSSQCYATRALTTNAYINFQANGTYYFSIRMLKGISWWGWPGDNAGGFGFASSAATNADIVGVGLTRDNFLAADGSTDLSDTVYITAGTLDQPGITGHPDDSAGPYYPRATGPAGEITDLAAALVGELTTTATGASTLSVSMIPQYAAIPSDPTTITWDATWQFTETNVMKQLLVWEHGSGPAIQGAIRVGTAWSDVVGLEFIGPIQASPAATVYSGSTVTLSQLAALNTSTYPMSFQWLSNGVAIDPTATNSTMVLADTTTNITANYSLVASNYYGLLTNTILVTSLPGNIPVFSAQPAPVIYRYAGGTVNVTVGVNGTPPFGLQLKHAGTNVIPAVTSRLALPGQATLSYGPISPADAGSYTVTATNAEGSATSAAALLTLLTPSPASYAAAITSLSPYGYWRLDDAGDTNEPAVIHDEYNGNDGVALDSTAKVPVIKFGLAGAPYFGFPVNHKAIGTTEGGSPSRLDLPALPYFTNTMTFALWVKDGCDIMAMANDGVIYGLETASSTSDLLFNWGTGVQWDTGLALSPGTWTFVALVVEPTQATVYVGSTNDYPIVSAVDSGLALYDSITLGDTNFAPLALGRYPEATDLSGSPAGWDTLNCTMSDVAVIYQSVPAATITNLFMAGVGLHISGVPDGAGNLVLNWFPGETIQEASSVTGPYTDVAGSPTPPYSVPISSANRQHYYRVRQ